MPSTSLRSFACLFLSFLFYSSACSRRVNAHHALHRHRHPRQITEVSVQTVTAGFTFLQDTPTGADTITQYATAWAWTSPNYDPDYNPDATTSSGAITQYVTASAWSPGYSPNYSPDYNPNYNPTYNPDININGNQLASDFSSFLNGLSNLPGDLMRFIQAIEQRFAAVESMLASFIGSQPGGSSSVTYNTITYSYPGGGPSPTYPLPPWLCSPSDGVGPPTPCPPVRTTRSYSTSFQTITISAPYPVANRTSGPYATGTEAPHTSVIVHTITVEQSPRPSPPAPSMYTFNPYASNNVAVYYGQSPATQQGGLSMLCSNDNVDIVVLAFVSTFFGPNGYPSISFGPGCSGPNEVQNATAPGLADCSELAIEIQQCQQMGKKVLVSLGGYIASSSFTEGYQPQQFARTLWNLFGAGTGDSPAMRPFGPEVVVDGFDIDNENHDSSYYYDFTNWLREYFSSDPSKTYYISAAPQCPWPDDSIPLEVMTYNADFVWVQFYNNPQCNLDSAGFQSSFEAWSQNFTARSPRVGIPRLYIGAGAFPGAGTGYVPGSGLSSVVSQVRELNVNNLGGIMLWDGSEAMANVDQYGNDYIKYAKAALEL